MGKFFPIFYSLNMFNLLKKKNKTTLFIDKYCVPLKSYRYITRDPEIVQNDWDEMLAAQTPEVDLDKIADVLCNIFPYLLGYQQTAYWQICRNKKALDEKHRCQTNFAHDNRFLEVHHKTYDFKGSEAQNMECLITMCRSCHRAHHKEEKRKEKEGEVVLNPSYGMEKVNNGLDRIHNKDAEVLTSHKSKINSVPIDTVNKAICYLEASRTNIAKIKLLLL